MGTNIRPELSKKNPYYIPKYRYYELKYFCLQYEDWQRAYHQILIEAQPENLPREGFSKNKSISDPTGVYATWLAVYGKNIELVKRCAADTDVDLYDYILEAVTKGRSFKFLDSVRCIPCGKDMFYDRYRRFFYLLSREKTY